MRCRRGRGFCCSTKCCPDWRHSEFESAIDTVRRIRDRGTSIVLVEHVVRVVMALADRVVVLNHGRVIADGNPYAVMADPAVIAAYIGRPHDALD